MKLKIAVVVAVGVLAAAFGFNRSAFSPSAVIENTATISSSSPIYSNVLAVPRSELGSTTGENIRIKNDGLVPVARVVDGDTIVVAINGAEEKVRLIGVDTPETVDPRKPVQCFGREASDFTKSVLSGARVRLKADPSQGDRDKYGRLLRYVFLADGTNFNLRLIKDGYAHEYTYHLPYKYQKEFKQAQKEAELNQGGLWAPGVCGNS